MKRLASEGMTRDVLDLGALSMTDIIRLQNDLSVELTRRFEKPMAVAFSDIVGSSAFFGRFGDAEGRQLQQRHHDLLERSIATFDGRIVDTAGDGAFLCFQEGGAAIDGLAAFARAITDDNALQARHRQLAVRIGFHWAPVLTDGVHVTGDAVNLCARVGATAEPGEIRLTRAAFQELSGSARQSCRFLGTFSLKGIDRPIDLLVYAWRDRSLFPTHVRIQETQRDLALPELDTISFGRLAEDSAADGILANDVVLAHSQPSLTNQISRWHFELRRTRDGLFLRQLSDRPTEVDGVTIVMGGEAPVRPGSTVRVARVVTLTFFTPPSPGAAPSTALPT